MFKFAIHKKWMNKINEFSVATSTSPKGHYAVDSSVCLCMLCVFVCFPPSAILIMSNRSGEVWTNESTQKKFCFTKSRLGDTSLCANDACNRSRRMLSSASKHDMIGR